MFVIASGLSFLETGSNTFIAALGDPRTSEQRLNLSQSLNPLGSITGALIGTVFIFSGIELKHRQIDVLKVEGTLHAYLRSEILRVVRPYMVLGVLVWVMAILILQLKRAFSNPKSHKISFPEATFIGIAGMVGGGVFAVLGLAAVMARGGTAIAFTMPGLVALLRASSYAKLSVVLPACS